MYLIRKLEENDFKAMSDIAANAYPDFVSSSPEEKEKLIKGSLKLHNEHPYINFYGAFNNDKMLGCMRYHDFKMNLLSEKVNAGGIGFVAVDILHKKEKVAKEIVKHFLEHYRSKGACLALLYPFRPDFYKKMGFGFGTSMNQYKVIPGNLPKSTTKEHIEFLTEKDVPDMCDCYSRYCEKTNGIIEKIGREFQNIFLNPALKAVGFKRNGEIQGYIIFQFKQNRKNHMLDNDIIINYFIYENKDAFYELMTFLNSQNDQIKHVIFNTQDEGFRFLLDDPRDDSDFIFTPVYHQCSLQGTGIMYRVVDVKSLFKALTKHNFNNANCKLKLTLKDTFMDNNNGSFIIDFKNGYPEMIDTTDYDVEIKLDICDFSSLITCAIDFKSLLRFYRASISDEKYINTVNNIFSTAERPICLTQF